MQNKKKALYFKNKTAWRRRKGFKFALYAANVLSKLSFIAKQKFKKSQLSFIASCGTIFSTSCAIPEAIINTLVYNDI